LIWGYPRGGRGKNIKTILNTTNFSKTLKWISKIDKEISEQDFKEGLYLKGIGISTLTKFLCFFKKTVNNKPCLILDDQLISVMRSQKFKDLKSLKNIKRKNFQNYKSYLVEINILSNELDFKEDKLEIFFFKFGKTLKKYAT